MLIAPAADSHVRHGHAEAQFTASGAGFATCPLTQGSLMRPLTREGQSAEPARPVLQEIPGSPRPESWPGNASHHGIPAAGITGHRQVTNACLAHLARSHPARLATSDHAPAKLHPDVTDLIPAA